MNSKEFAERLGLSESTLWNRINKGEISQPHRITQKDVFWYECEVKAIVEKTKKESDTIACT